MNAFEREFQLIGLKYSQMSQAELLETIEAKYATLSPYMDERTRRIWAAVEARSLGWGGVSRVAEATGM